MPWCPCAACVPTSHLVKASLSNIFVDVFTAIYIGGGGWMGRGEGEPQVFMYRVELLDGDNAVVVEVPDKTMVIKSAVTQTTVLDLGKS